MTESRTAVPVAVEMRYKAQRVDNGTVVDRQLVNEESEGATARPRARRAVADGGWEAARATALGGTGPSPTRDPQALVTALDARHRVRAAALVRVSSVETPPRVVVAAVRERMNHHCLQALCA